ncbi:MAG: Signal transduction histidine kinase [Candidatus Lokiarchaeum sp. GC14_75]|nr:MAG: Signal transduction histidine kinase [Candidatus Lokiarchaeum sp. GC14_75]
MESLNKENYNPEEHLFNTLNNLDIGFVKVNNTGVILNHNLFFNKIFGYNPEKNLIGTKILDYWQNTDDRDNFRKILYKNDIVKKYITSAKNLDGKQIFLELNFKLEKNSNGEIISSEGIFVDITKRTETEQRLKESERKSQNIIENLPMGVHTYQLGKDGHLYLIGSNPAADQILGVDNSLSIGKTIDQAFPNIVDTDIPEKFGEIAEKGGFWHKEDIIYEDKRIKGAFENFNFQASPGIVVSMFNDISERKKAEQKLKESEKKLRNLNIQLEQRIEERTWELKESENKLRKFMDSATDGIIIFDSKLNYIDVNNITLQTVDMTREELIGKNILDIAPGLKETGRYDKYLDVIKTGKPFSTEDIIFNRKDGSLSSFFSTRAFKVGNELGIIFTDITERKKAEEKLKESEKKYRNLFESCIDGIVLTDMEGRILDCNEKYSDMLGYTIEELQKLTYLQLTPEKWHAGEAEIVQNQFIAQGYSDEFEKEYIKKDGTIFPVALKGWLIKDENGNLEGMWGFIRDITESKKKEEEIRLHSEIMTNMSEGVYLIRLEDLIIVYVNPRFEQMFGYESGEMIGKYVVIVNAPTEKTPEETKNEIMGILQETGEWHGEVQNIKKDGTIFWCYANVSLFDHPEYGKVIVSVHTDITERKKREEEIIDEKNKLQTVINTIQNGLSVQDLEYNILYHNHVVTDLFGDCVGKKCYKIYEGNDKICLECPVELAFKDGKSHTIIRELKKPHSGEISYWENIANPIRNSEGKIVSCLEIATNITEIKKSEEEIKRIKESYERLTDNANVAIFRVKIKGRDIVYSIPVNPAAERLFGYSKAEWLSDSTLGFKIIHPDFVEKQKQIMGDINKNKKPIKNAVLGWIAKDGQEVILEYTIIPILDDNGDIVYFESIGVDITERKKSEETLKESERKLKEAQALGKIGYWEFDITNQQITWSDQVFKIYNRDPSLGPPSEEEEAHYYTSDTNERLKEYARRAIEFGEEFDYDLQANLPSGMVVHLSALMRTIKNRSGQVIKLTGTVQDITERIEKEKEIEEDLKEINQLKSEFLRRASHELKTPLISIKGFSDLILALYEDQLDPVIISKLREINDGCERLQNIINNLLKTSRLESTEIKPKVQKEDLSFLINFCVHELQALAERRKQSIKLDIHDNLFVNMEKEEIHDVLSNILTNAIKYTPPKGKIEVKTELKKDFVVVSVSDNGIGFTEEQKKMIFQQFGKIERYGKGLDLGIDGTGLGLYISKRIVEMHDGKIWMESEGKSKGSTFYFTLPTAKR